MKSAITQKDIARRLGVSQALVSRVLTGNSEKIGVAPATAEKIRAAAAACHYRPSAAALTLKGGPTRTLGVVVKNFEDPFFGHMIGTMQRNKVKKAVEATRLIHSVDSLRLAEEIQIAAARRETPIEVLVEVNISGESSKQGVAPGAARHLVAQIDTMVNVRPRGLMCMAPLTGGADAARATFERCRELYDDIRQVGAGGERFDILSMGMTSDFEIAVQCGSNMVRVGSAVIGPPQVTEEPADS
jgi:pyridoxal phosphate enzyme (YggS family)